MKALEVAVQVNAPVVMVSKPGEGKSQSILAMAEAMDLPCEVMIGSVREPSDFGLPVIREDRVVLLPPAEIMNLVDAGKGILFLDELSTAAPAVQAAMLRVIQERVVGQVKLPDAVAIIAAMNPPECAANGWDLTAPMANRLVHLPFHSSHEEWTKGMVNGWATPSIQHVGDWKSYLPQARALVASFINHRPHLLHKMPEDEAGASGPWPSHRSWGDFVTKFVAAQLSTPAIPSSVVNDLIVGSIGEGAALEFLSWRRELDLPDPELLLESPGLFSIQSRPDLTFAVLASVTSAILARNTADRWNAGWEILCRAGEQGAKDVAMVSAKSLANSQPANTMAPIKVLEMFGDLVQAVQEARRN